MTFVSKQCTWHGCSNSTSRVMTFVFVPYEPMKSKFCMTIIAKLWPMKFMMQGCQYHFHTSKTYLHLWTIGSWINCQHYCWNCSTSFSHAYQITSKNGLHKMKQHSNLTTWPRFQAFKKKILKISIDFFLSFRNFILWVN